MRAIFIADAHLRHEGDENYRLLVEFLTELRGTVDTLFILGDLFEFWIGYETVPFTHYLPILKKLQELAENGTEIVYLEGNHDFHMGPFFTKTLAPGSIPARPSSPSRGNRSISATATR